MTPKGKIIILKSFAVSQLVYLFSVLPTPPKSFLKDLNTMFFKFIWDNKPDKVKRSTMYNTFSGGGLNMMDMDSFVKSLKTKWVKLYLDDNFRPWKSIFNFALRNYGGPFLFHCNFQKQDVETIPNIFVKQVCEAWSSYAYYTPDKSFGDQIIFNNSFVKINSSIFYIDSLRSADVYLVKHFFDADGNVLQYNDFIFKYHIDNLPFTTYFGIVSAIPRHWRLNFGDSENISVPHQKFTKFIVARKETKCVYRSLISQKVTVPRAVARWEHDYPDIDFDWSRVFSLPFTSIRNPKVQYLQFRFIHRILATNTYLYKLNLSDTKICSFCNENDETLVHLFWSCSRIQSFWSELFHKCLKKTLDFSMLTICFGFLDIPTHPINFLILHAKNFIFSCKLNNKIPEPGIFIYKLKFLLDVEYSILKRHNKNAMISLFDETFNMV